MKEKFEYRDSYLRLSEVINAVNSAGFVGRVRAFKVPHEVNIYKFRINRRIIPFYYAIRKRCEFLLFELKHQGEEEYDRF